MGESKNMSEQKAFTLIELLMVIAVIGLISTIVLVSVNTARKKARDAKRMADLNQLNIALEMYYEANGSYPNRHYQSTQWGWLNRLGSDLSPYISAMPLDPINNSTYRFYYDGGESDDYPGYGLMCRFEHSGNFSIADNDGGYYNQGDGRYYEIGPEPAYDAPARNWWSD